MAVQEAIEAGEVVRREDALRVAGDESPACAQVAYAQRRKLVADEATDRAEQFGHPGRRRARARPAFRAAGTPGRSRRTLASS
jgi:hypothetical protein